ncbi:MAG: glycosyltransferase family 39 protein [Elusimicrobia bacterium]|nr:glycosyltransferase family 39 protein [Elusimicrobiota bacterium]
MTRAPKLLLVLMGLGLALRWGLALKLQEKDYQPDEGVYITIARNFRDYGVLGDKLTPNADKPPVTAAAIRTCFALFGDRLWAARMVWGIMGVAAAWGLYLYASLLFGRTAGLLAGGFAAIYPFFIYWSSILMSEMPAIFLVVFALLYTEKARRPEGKTWEAWLAGLLWGLATLNRTQTLGFVLVMLVWAALFKAKKSVLLGLALPALLLPSLWLVRNGLSLDTWTLDTHSGYTAVIRVMFYDEDNIDTGVADAALQKAPFYAEAMALPPAERDRFFFKQAVDYIKANPLRYAKNCAGNFLQFWRFYPRPDKSVGVTPGSFLHSDRRYFIWLSLLTEPALILLGLAGLILGIKERAPVALPILWILANTAVHTLVISQMRYRIPVMPMVILLAAYAVARKAGQMRESA